MKQRKSFVFRSFGPSMLQQGVIVSVMLHLVIFLIFFTMPLMRSLQHPQIITITFQNESERPATSQATADPRPARHQVIAPWKSHTVVPEQTKKVESIPAMSYDEKAMVQNAEKVVSENQPPMKQGLNAVARSTAKTDSTSSVLSRVGFNTDDGSENSTPKGVAEARFGERGAPSFLYQELPVYPVLARRLGKEGRVLLKLLIDAEGKLQNVEVVEAAGYGFTEASVEAVKKSTYVPGYRDGVKVATRALLPVRFHLQ